MVNRFSSFSLSREGERSLAAQRDSENDEETKGEREKGEGVQKNWRERERDSAASS